MQESTPQHASHDHGDIPPTLTSPAAAAFWSAILLTGIGAGIAAGLLTLLLTVVARSLDARSIYDVRSENPGPG